jgi:hypothetical protein
MANPKKPSKKGTVSGSKGRRQLAQATTHYFESLSPHAMAEENSIAESLHEATAEIEFDHEL